MNEPTNSTNLIQFPRASARDPVDLAPGTAYELITRTKLEELASDVRDIRRRIDGIFWLVATSIVVQLALRALGIET